MELKNLIAVTGNNDSILGKLVYFSLSNILIEKDAFEEAGIKLGLPKAKPIRESPVDAFNSATGDIRDRKVVKNGVKKIIKVYVRDNDQDKSQQNMKSRELVLEELGVVENKYQRIASIFYNKDNDSISYETTPNYYYGIDPEEYCKKAEELFYQYRRCYGRGTIETILYNFLDSMEAIKISVHGKLFFVPRHNVHMTDILEDYVEELNNINLNDGNSLVINSIWVMDDDKQRKKMEDEFYGSSDVYTMSFRVVRFPISDSEHECLVTNLPVNEFPAQEIDRLYFMRWGVESSFRKLKYTIGLSNLHARKTEYVKQEVWARLIAYNFTETITNNVIVLQNDTKYAYQVDFSVTAHICRVFMRPTPNKSGSEVTVLIQKHTQPIRPDRMCERLKTAHFRKPRYFTYRAA